MSSELRSSPLRLGVVVLTVEKLAQHALTALFFAADIPGIGKPNIGDRFLVGDYAMVGLNLLYAGAFGLGLIGFLRGRGWSGPLLTGLALLDVVLEFLFHGFLYITVSVLVSVLLTALLLRSRREGVSA